MLFEALYLLLLNLFGTLVAHLLLHLLHVFGEESVVIVDFVEPLDHVVELLFDVVSLRLHVLAVECFHRGLSLLVVLHFVQHQAWRFGFALLEGVILASPIRDAGRGGRVCALPLEAPLEPAIIL